MSQDEFAVAIATTVSAFGSCAERFAWGSSESIKSLLITNWFKGFVGEEYNGWIENDILEDVLSKEPRHNPFKED